MRHNVVKRRLEHVLKGKGCTTKIEPRITADQGLKIQDLCAWKSDNYIVCDVAFLRCFQLGQEGLEIRHPRCSQVNVEECPSWHPEVASGCGYLNMQWERSDR